VFKSTIVVVCAVAALAACQPGGGSGGSDNLNTVTLGDYTVLAWNDLGMHCMNPGFAKIMVLPPFNTLRAQVIQRGDPPVVVTADLTVEYSIENNTTSSTKTDFWSAVVAQLATLMGLGSTPAANVGLTGNGLTGTMAVDGAQFVASGIPVTPLLDSMAWNPYQVALLTVRDAGSNIIAQTRATVPVSDEMNCAACHGASDPYGDMLDKHDANHDTSLASATPVICAECHDDAALGISGKPNNSLSLAMHGWHAAQDPEPTCYQCHPGATTRCSRSTAHTAAGGNCASCHGTLDEMAAGLVAGRAPWTEEPACVTCHAGVADVDTGANLYRNSAGHGGVACTACHGSPHAMLPTNQVPGYPNADAYQEKQVQGYTSRVKTIGSCGVCHSSSRGESETAEFAEEHGGVSPRQKNGCNACHTATPTTTASWPHAFQWRNSN
jgi:hypothetical protein